MRSNVCEQQRLRLSTFIAGWLEYGSPDVTSGTRARPCFLWSRVLLLLALANIEGTNPAPAYAQTLSNNTVKLLSDNQILLRLA
jgi:hypothetical protein